MVKIGLVGLPNAGKSTLFNFLTNNSVAVGNYPFTTIDSNIALMPIYDRRLKVLKTVFNAQRIVNSYVKIWDIAGLIKNAHTGAGLGNKFLAYIREVDAICYVVNGFELLIDDPLEAFLIGKLEIIMADVQLLQKFTTEKPQFWANYHFAPREARQVVAKALALLNREQFLTTGTWTLQEWELLRKLNLLTTKKILVLINVGIDFFLSALPLKIKKLTTFLQQMKINYLFLPVDFLRQQKDLKLKAQKRAQIKYNYHLNGIEQFCQKVLETFSYQFFYTASVKEIRGWFFRVGTNARVAAGLIHSDFAKNFIRLKVLSWSDFVNTSSLLANLPFKTVGANYLLQNGDICHFLVQRGKNR